MAGAIDSASVQRVRQALDDLGSSATVIELSETARSAEDAARSIGTELGSIVKSLVFTIGGRPVMALVAGDRKCRLDALPEALGMEGAVKRADAHTVREITGFAIGGVAPIAHRNPVPIVIDGSLGRFETIYAAAGHPHCVFATSLGELTRITPGIVSDAVSEGS